MESRGAGLVVACRRWNYFAPEDSRAQPSWLTEGSIPGYPYLTFKVTWEAFVRNHWAGMRWAVVTGVWRHIPCPCPELPRQGSGKIYNSTALVHFRLLVLDRVQATSMPHWSSRVWRNIRGFLIMLNCSIQLFLSGLKRIDPDNGYPTATETRSIQGHSNTNLFEWSGFTRFLETRRSWRKGEGFPWPLYHAKLKPSFYAKVHSNFENAMCNALQ